MGVPASLTGVMAARDHARIRAAALMRLHDRSHPTDPNADPDPFCVARLIAESADEPALLGLHVWRIEATAFDRSPALCRRHVTQAAEWTGSTMTRPGSARLSWLLDARTGGARLGAWVLAMYLDFGGTLPGPDPYAAYTLPRPSDQGV